MLRRLVQRTVGIPPGETSAAAWAAMFFFCVLCSYYALRPVREEMGIAGGAEDLPWLFLCTLGAMLFATPVFGWLVSRFTRRVFIAITYRFFIANLLLFYGVLLLTQESRSVITGYVFYIWLSVFNLFIVSLFWALAADVFSLARSKRLFGALAAGGTMGAITGAALTANLIEIVGRANLILVSAVILEGAARCASRLARHAPPVEPGRAWARNSFPASPAPKLRDALAGIRQTAQSPYLLGITLFILALTVTSTVAYFEQGRIVDDAFETDRDAKIIFFAQLDLWVNVLTLVLQLGIARLLLAKVGTGATLAVLPVITAAGFAALLLAPSLATLAAFQIARRAGNYGLAKPARETLFTVVSTQEKYKAKTFIDTFVYRAGDGIAALAATAFSLAPLVIAAIPISLGWLVIALLLGRRQRTLAMPGPRCNESTPLAAPAVPAATEP